MGKAAGWNAYQLLQRDRRPSAAGDTPAVEVARLRDAIIAVVGRMPRPLLAFSGQNLLCFFAEHGATLGLTEPHDYDATRDVAAGQIDAILAELRLMRTPRGGSALERRLAWLVATLALDDADGAILNLFARIAMFPAWRDFVRATPGLAAGLRPSAVAALTGLPIDVAEARLNPGSGILGNGLVVDNHDENFEASHFLARVARMHTDNPALLSERMLPPALPSTLDWDDFAHLSSLRDLALKAIVGAAASGGGMSLLLHGIPGTGKSELARLLAYKAGLTPVFAGLADEQGGEPTRQERLAHLNVLRGLTRGSSQHVVIVDEADDVLALTGINDRDRMSKLWLNRLVEESDAPTIWITNDPDRLGDAIVRRMTMAIGFDLPPLSVRTRVIERAARKADMVLAREDVLAAAALPAAPAVLSNAVEAARLGGGRGTDVVRAGESLLAALGQRHHAAPPTDRAYDPALAYADQDLDALARQLAASPERGWSLLLSGPSGTGKSAFARHLAERVGIEVEERRGSDLLSPFVGGTEAKIAAAFTRAGERGAMLLIDEADSFLFDRAGAQRSWESGMVNEMLRWMESLRAPFVATTNLADGLDPATQRRFTLRVVFRTLTPTRAAGLFERYFGARLPSGTAPLESLTPGDFGVVAARATLLGERNLLTLTAWLVAEAEARGARCGAAGFHLPIPEPRLCEVA